MLKPFSTRAPTTPSEAAETIRPLVAVRKLSHFGDLPLPTYETGQSAGMDLRAALAEGSHIDLLPGRRALIPAGKAMHRPVGIRARRPGSKSIWLPSAKAARKSMPADWPVS